MEQQGRGDPINMSSSGMSDKELEAIGELLASEDFREGDAQLMRRQHALSTPVPWDADYLKKLATHRVGRVVEPGVPGWGKVVVQDREFFQDCGISAETDAPGQVYKVLYCSQQPHYMGLCPLVEVPVPSGSGCYDGADGLRTAPVVKRFTCSYARFCTAMDMEVPAGARIWWWPRLRHEGGGVCVQ